MSNKKHGFTIIEVVLVLAIAGLIFLMVFVALPALQRSQRDTQRRQDVARVVTAITQYQANNGGKIPLPSESGKAALSYGDDKINYPCTSDNKLTQFRCNYLGGEDFKDPNGEEYRIRTSYNKPGGAPDAIGYILIYRGVDCSTYTATAAPSNNDYAVVTKLEGSGTYCLDNK